MATIEELEAKLASAKAARAAAAAERDAPHRLLELERQIALEELEAANEAAIGKAEDEYGLVGSAIATVFTECGVVILKRPPSLIFKRFQEMGKTKEEDLLKLVRPCLVHPSKDLLDKYCDEQPATLLRCADAVAVLAGVRSDEVRGK